MDIAGLSMSLAQVELGGRIGTAVLDKAMESNEALGTGLIQMIDAAAMEYSVNPAVGGNFDFRI